MLGFWGVLHIRTVRFVPLTLAFSLAIVGCHAAVRQQGAPLDLQSERLRPDHDGCVFTDSAATPLRWTIASGYHLRSDRRGSYVHGVRNQFGALYNIPKLQGQLPPLDDPTLVPRFITLRLNQPIDRAPALGVVESRGPGGGQIWAFYRVNDGRVEDFRSIAVGERATGERLLVFFMIDSTRHVLIAGDVEGRGACGDFPVASFLRTPSTTPPIITRTSRKSWRIELPLGSTAMLWRWQSRSSVPIGRYQFSARIDIEAIQ